MTEVKANPFNAVRFDFLAASGDHEPSYLVAVDASGSGPMIPINGHADYKVDDARAQWMADTLNSALAGEVITVIDPSEWEPCSPSYLERGGQCSAPRVWNVGDQNHWHPKLASPAQVDQAAGDVCQTCSGSGKEGLNSDCRDCGT